MVATYDLDIIGRTDLPGELHEPPVWEEAVEADCGLCGRVGADTGTGLCPCCLDCTPRAGGCGKAAAVAVAVLGGEAGPGGALAHLTGCRDCREAFGWLATVGTVAEMENDYAGVPASFTA